ncbi:putative endonuclease [Rhodoligotrophos appendicifer]|uniref:YraN family protein n=1 Tax=Rhodoligotrophos appendicifer TaxID=987056 RepID=UPI00117E1B42|nr:YraN family protein [Rhodoligotrophos appendicifer]
MAERTPELSRRQAYRRGHRAESVAALLLRLKGFRILERRTKTPLGEIDLIAVRGSLIIFVEVKQRARNAATLEVLTPRQQQRIMRAAHYWLPRHPSLSGHNYRFDMVVVQPYLWPQHIADAFTAGSHRSP